MAARGYDGCNMFLSGTYGGRIQSALSKIYWVYLGNLSTSYSEIISYSFVYAMSDINMFETPFSKIGVQIKTRD